MKSVDNQNVGRTGEDLAVKYLQQQGYQILQKNFKIRYGEIDIIALKDGTLTFFEVKTRTSEKFGKPEEAISSKKLKSILKTAYFYISQLQKQYEYQVDVIAIKIDGNDGSKTRIEHIKNIME